jgi:hypothetical protein
MPTILDALRAELVTAGVGRTPRTDNPDLPPIFLARSPLQGAGDTAGLNPIEVGRDAVIGLYVAGGIPAPAMESDRRRDRIDVWIRVRQNDAPRAYRIGAAIRAAVVDRINYKLGGEPDGIRVVQSLEWAALQPVETGIAGQSDTWVYMLLFESYAGADGWRSEPAA